MLDVVYHFELFTPFFYNNYKSGMVSTHILKSGLLSCNSTHQTALNKNALKVRNSEIGRPT